MVTQEDARDARGRVRELSLKKVLELSKNFLEGVFKKKRLEIKKVFAFSLM